MPNLKKLLLLLCVSSTLVGCNRFDVNDSARAETPGDVFGYTTAFNQELKKIGQISPQEFAQRYKSNAEYLPQITWDSTTAKFWQDFNLNPEENNKNPQRKNLRYNDFRLNSAELAVFKKNGFVVSERMGTQSFAEMYYRIYTNDLPVFVSADSILHAWHNSYDSMLEQLEETYLARSLDEILRGMANKIPEAASKYGNGALGSSLQDADYFLAVARSLLTGKTVKSYLNQDERVAVTLTAIETQQTQKINLFGRDRTVDFSQFKVRGHYEHSEQLKKYFRAMMWCGRIDLRIAGAPETSSPRELGTAIALYDLLQNSGKFQQWQQFDQMIQTFVGRTDSMTFAQLGEVLNKAGIKSPVDIKNLATLATLEYDILNGKIGVQDIRGDVYKSPLGVEKAQLPRSFTVLSQKFVLDSWVMSKVVFDDILWDGKKVQRFVPTSLDVAFATLGNNQVVPNLIARIKDGFNYQHNLAAVRNVVDMQKPSVWQENIYMNWLATLRQLSSPTTDVKYPEAMRNQAWAMKTLNTQLASWTQLRHDTILYAKPSYSELSCEYPAGFVEPRPEFWERFEQMAKLAAEQIKKTPFPDSEVQKPGDEYQPSLKDIQAIQVEFLQQFAQKLAVLKEISAKELAQKPLTEVETKFLKEIVEIQRDYVGQIQYNGWYPRLFYSDPDNSGKWDALVADVHTNPSNSGSVLHQAVGNVDLLMIAVDNGKDRMVYAGPVMSHYEFEVPGSSRKSDSEWRKDINQGSLPPRPDWTQGYFVPGENKDAKLYPRTDEQWVHKEQFSPGTIPSGK
ncbi:MAG: DUF3160 domain-containing protein [Nostoc sp. ChiQUE02]|uniref:DUF3160 domain-containing protein n=1 Tax=Nostoc sp. ChiQUE02 TaxID=3075377 RepID=UPI002AD364C9|nr:DUF3160 domain-containing protein [Nostoc sp. ChiQUE02]MDZ8233109.1 DUF3160 domain-containing protein [Nostoc sp. ChiQUE02]